MTADKLTGSACRPRVFVGSVWIVLVIIERVLSFYQSHTRMAGTLPTNTTNPTDSERVTVSGLSGLSFVGSGSACQVQGAAVSDRSMGNASRHSQVIESEGTSAGFGCLGN
jgi:hypothetical protein